VKLLTLARDLQRRRARERQGLFVCEGVRTVEELLRSALKPRGALVAPQLTEQPRGAALLQALHARAVQVQEVSASDFATAAETETPQGVLAIAEVPEQTFGALPATASLRLLVLDALQDPGNVGTILRTAAALGAFATIALPGTVDLWNAKVVRSAMGAGFHTPAFSATWEAVDQFRQRESLALWGADAGGTSLHELSAPDRLGLVVGNEGAGLSAEARARVQVLASLPIDSKVESLNVAVATGILLYQLRT
jgi:TrmH family RNA methyltransferase